MIESERILHRSVAKWAERFYSSHNLLKLYANLEKLLFFSRRTSEQVVCSRFQDELSSPTAVLCATLALHCSSSTRGSGNINSIAAAAEVQSMCCCCLIRTKTPRVHACGRSTCRERVLIPRASKSEVRSIQASMLFKVLAARKATKHKEN